MKVPAERRSGRGAQLVSRRETATLLREAALWRVRLQSVGWVGAFARTRWGCGWLERYELLMPVLMQQDDEPSLAQLAVSSGMTAGALRVTLHRMRGHYRSMIKRELALTLDTEDPKLLREEMVELLKAFA